MSLKSPLYKKKIKIIDLPTQTQNLESQLKSISKREKILKIIREKMRKGKKEL